MEKSLREGSKRKLKSMSSKNRLHRAAISWRRLQSSADSAEDSSKTSTKASIRLNTFEFSSAADAILARSAVSSRIEAWNRSGAVARVGRTLKNGSIAAHIGASS